MLSLLLNLVPTRDNYKSILIFFIISVGLAIVLFILPQIISVFRSKTSSSDKASQYECGFQPFSSSHKTFDVHFVIVAVLFLLFDFELLIIFPFLAGQFNPVLTYGPFPSVGLFLFLLMLLIAFAYE
jgi:NADH-quinone oxidoreductase subunit A